MHLAALQTSRPPALRARVLARQRRLHAPLRQVEPAGQLMASLGTQFVVSPTVFWPREESQPLVQHGESVPGERVRDRCTGAGVPAVLAAYAGAHRPGLGQASRRRAHRHNECRATPVCWRDCGPGIRPLYGGGPRGDVRSRDDASTVYPASRQRLCGSRLLGAPPCPLSTLFLPTSSRCSPQVAASPWGRRASGPSPGSTRLRPRPASLSA